MGAHVSFYKAEYIWIDGAEPTAKLRSKTKIVRRARSRRSGASTARAPTRPRATRPTACCKPVCTVPDPVRGGDEQARHVRGPPHRHGAAPDEHARARSPRSPKKLEGARDTGSASSRSTRSSRACKPARLAGQRLPRAAVRLLLRRRRRRGLRARHRRGAHGRLPQGGPAARRHQRRGHARAVGVPDRPAGPLEVADHLWVARWLLYRIAEDHGASATLEPEAGQGRLERRRRAHQLLDEGDARVLRRVHQGRRGAQGKRHALHIANYGFGIEERLTGKHETCSYKEFKYGVSDRGASVRIPWQVAQRQEGLHRGSPPVREHGPVRRHAPHHGVGLGRLAMAHGAHPPGPPPFVTAHPWHGVPLGDDAPARVTAYIEIVPTDTVKYELDKVTGLLKIDRPQKFSNVPPSLYGFLPHTYCAEQVAATLHGAHRQDRHRRRRRSARHLRALRARHRARRPARHRAPHRRHHA